MTLSQATIQRPGEEAEVDRSLIKILFFGLITVAANGAAIYGFKSFLETFNYFFLFLALIAGLIFLTAAALNVLFIKSFTKIFLIILLAVVLPVLLFYPDFSMVVIAGAAVFLAWSVSASQRAFNIAVNSVKVKFFSVVGPALAKTITGLLLFATAIFFVKYFDFNQKVFNERINNEVVHQFLVLSQPAVGLFAPKFSPQAKSEDVFNSFIKEQVRKITPKFESQLPSVQQRIINEAGKMARQTLESRLGKLDFEKSFEENTRLLINRWLDNLTAQQKLTVAVVLAVVFFAIVKSFSFLLFWFVELTAFVVFKFLLLINFAHVSLENRSREFIILN